MKKILFIFVVLVTMFNINAQSRSLCERNIGIGFDYLLGTDYISFMSGGAGYVVGFYVDILHGSWNIDKKDVDINNLIVSAESKMYKDKSDYYKAHDRRAR